MHKHSPYCCNTINHEPVPEKSHCSKLLLQQCGLRLCTVLLQNSYTWISMFLLLILVMKVGAISTWSTCWSYCYFLLLSTLRMAHFFVETSRSWHLTWIVFYCVLLGTICWLIKLIAYWNLYVLDILVLCCSPVTYVDVCMSHCSSIVLRFAPWRWKQVPSAT